MMITDNKKNRDVASSLAQVPPPRSGTRERGTRAANDDSFIRDKNAAAQQPAVASASPALSVPRKCGFKKVKTKPQVIQGPPAPKPTTEDALVAMGIHSLKFLQRGEYEMLDPVVGDWACQLRTIWLTEFAKTHVDFLQRPTPQAVLRSERSPISLEDLKILGFYRLLTALATRKPDALGMRIELKTQKTLLDEADGCFSSRKLLESGFSAGKTEFPDMVNRHLAGALSASNLRDKAELLLDLERPIFRETFKRQTSVVGFFVGCKVVLELAAERNLPLAVTIKHFVRDKKDDIRLVGGDYVSFQAQGDGLDKQQQYVPTQATQRGDEPCLAIHMYAALRETETGEDAENFFANAKLLGTEKFTETYLAIAAKHPQHPDQTFYRTQNVEKLKLDEHDADVTPYIASMRQASLAYAEKERVGLGSYYENGAHFKESIPLNILHIHVSTQNKVRRDFDAYLTAHRDKVQPALSNQAPLTEAGRF